MGRKSNKARDVAVLGAASLVLLGAWAVFATHPARTLPAGEPLVENGIALTPLSVTEQESIGSTQVRSGRSFYVVRFQVSNRTRAPFRYEMHQVLVRAVEGDRIVRSGPGQTALNGEGDQVTLQPNQSAERCLAFESSPGSTHVAVLFSLEWGPGVFLRGLIGSSKQVVLTVRQAKAQPQSQSKTEIKNRNSKIENALSPSPNSTDCSPTRSSGYSSDRRSPPLGPDRCLTPGSPPAGCCRSRPARHRPNDRPTARPRDTNTPRERIGSGSTRRSTASRSIPRGRSYRRSGRPH